MTTISNLPQIVPHPQFVNNHILALFFGRRVTLVHASTGAAVFTFDADLLSQEQLHQKKRSEANFAKLSSKQQDKSSETASEGKEEESIAGTDESNISCLKFYSNDALDVDFMAVGSDNKRLYVFACDRKENMEWKLVGSAVVKKKVSCVAMATNMENEQHVEVIFGDKFGDGYGVDATDMWNRSKESGEPVFVAEPPLKMGHISTLMDMVITPDEKFIITADRDEKIRVSHFPRVYEIENFCLGHTELVTCVDILRSPTDAKDIMLSGSGDGTLRVWDYTNNEDPLLYTVESGSEQRIPQIVNSYRVGEDIFVMVLFERESSVSLFRYVESNRSLKFVQKIECGSQVTSARFSAHPQNQNGALLWTVQAESGKHISAWEILPAGDRESLTIQSYEGDASSTENINRQSSVSVCSSLCYDSCDLLYLPTTALLSTVSFTLAQNKILYFESMKKRRAKPKKHDQSHKRQSDDDQPSSEQSKKRKTNN